MYDSGAHPKEVCLKGAMKLIMIKSKGTINPGRVERLLKEYGFSE
jgi:hypothetical protein